MKKTSLILALAGFLTASLATSAIAAAQKITITGEGKCAKCALHETDECQNVIQTQENGKTVTYYLAQNKTSKNFHENLCRETKKVTATGTVKEENGKKVLTASKLTIAK